MSFPMADEAEKSGSAQEFDEMADWRGFQNLRLPTAVDDLIGPALDSWTAQRFVRAEFLPWKRPRTRLPRQACEPDVTYSFYDG